MSYLALARKWRPKSFDQVIGQDHVVKALSNSLGSERVHHAYLFAGTRGVGKTTVARILAKALNCDAGVSAEPCGKCSACTAIDEGRFVDLIEVDAASRTKVEQTRELLENVQYTPSTGRYKIYLIDEVHMLSTSSFNALLKTLEEPPPHVKFLLATTDPQKLPATVLSRCLQFNLKRLSTALVSERMGYISQQEGFDTETSALVRLARAANGSVRDGLSLLDQALAYGNGELRDASVAEMLGHLDINHLKELLHALAAGDGAKLIEHVRALNEQAPDYGSVLDELATVLQQLSIVQIAGAASLDEDADIELLNEFAALMSPEIVQLNYQIAIKGRQDLSIAPDPRVGFEMTLLRMLAFRPVDAGSVGSGNVPPTAASGGTKPAQREASKAPAPKKPVKKASVSKTPAVDASESNAASAPKLSEVPPWPDLVKSLRLRGATLQLARSCVMAAQNEGRFHLQIDSSSEYLLNDIQRDQLTKALSKKFAQSCSINFEVVDTEVDSEVKQVSRDADRQYANARESIDQDPSVKELLDVFDARLVDDSVKPTRPQNQK